MNQASPETINKVRKTVPLVLLALVAIFVCYRYVFVSDTERINRMLEKGVDAVEDRSLFRVSNLVATGYSDGMGFDRAALLQATQQIFQTFDAIDVKVKDVIFEDAPVDVTPGSDEKVARVKIVCSVVLHQGQGVLEIIDDDPDRNQSVVLDVVGSGHRWQVQRIEFRNVNIAGQVAF